MGQPRNFSEWLAGLPIPWLVSREVGAADATAQGTFYDSEVATLKEAVKARMPELGPSDALTYLGNDRQLIQGYAETDDEFRQRCKLAWDQWALAGTWAELLYQLYWTCGLDSSQTWIVQQNGYAYNLSANPAVDDDPTTLLQVTALGDNPTITYPDPVPWWTFDTRDDLCSRFAIIVDGPLPGTIGVTARADFDGSTNTVTATWSGPWDGTDYLTALSVTTTDGSAPVVVISAKTRTTVTVTASAPFEGYVDLLGWLSGANPFAGPSLTTRNTIKKIANRWKPAKAKYMGMYAVINGAVWGWPIGTKWGDPGLKWGAGLSTYFAP